MKLKDMCAAGGCVFSLSCLLVAALTLTMIAGCPFSGTGDPIRGNQNTNVNDNTGGTGDTFGVLNFRANLAFSDDVTLTVLYSVPSGALEVIGFLQLLNAPASAGGTPIGIEEIIATGLSAGLEQSFSLDTATLRPGFYRVGVRADGISYLSNGTMEIQGPPSPLFIEPSADVTVEQGDFVNILADVGDPQGVARWRLFYQDAEAPLNEEGTAAGGALLGTRITDGLGNTVDVSWDTRNLPIGSYRLGLSAADIGLTIAAAVQAGQADAIVTTHSDATVTVVRPPGSAIPPTIDLLTGDQTAFGGESVDIEFSADTFEGDEYVVTFFSIFNNTRTEFAPIEDRDVGTFTFDTADLPSGVYSIGATIFDGKNAEVEVPAAGRVSINVVQIGDATLTVSMPGDSVRIAQGDDVEIEWTTNVPADFVPVSPEVSCANTADCSGSEICDGGLCVVQRGTIDVFARQFDANSPLGIAGTEVSILSDVATSVSSAAWTTTTERGLFVIIVQLTIIDPAQTTPVVLTRTAPGTARISLTAAQFWLGQIGLGSASTRQGEVFQGVNFQDNAGTFLNAVGDYDTDGRDDFVVGARFAKPFFINPGGIGVGEAYLIYGDERRNTTINLNEVAGADLRGIAFTGVLPRDDAQTQTDGLSAIRLIPDQDGDRLPELAFGIPFVQSHGHTRRRFVDRNPASNTTLERPNQFERGGVVFVASTNTKLTIPDLTFTNNPDAPIEFRAVINLDLVGQNFNLTGRNDFETFEGGTNGCGDLIIADTLNFEPDPDDPTIGTCAPDATDDIAETFIGTQRGFSPALANHLGEICQPFTNAAFNPPTCYGVATHLVSVLPNPVGGCAATLGYAFSAIDSATEIGLTGPSPLEAAGDRRLGTGFYPVAGNVAREPFGARLIGNEVNDKFGASIAVSGDFLIISAPDRDPNVAVEIPGFTGALPTDPGIMYLINMNNLWPANLDAFAPPMPFQYQLGPFPEGAPTVRNSPSHCGRNPLLESSPSPFRILGETAQRIEVVEGIPDFNRDDREDFVVGAPLAGAGGQGAVNIVFRRDPFLEGDYILERLGRDPLDPERLTGVRLNGRAGEGFGEVIARTLAVINEDGSLSNETVDFNGDGRHDLILGNPNADVVVGNTTLVDAGEIIIVFTTDDLQTPAGGMSVDTLLAANDRNGNPRAIRITGRAAGDGFGFNAAVVGDFNGDGVNDLLVAAPGASPMFDSNDDGTLDTAGVDVTNLLDPESEFGDGAADVIAGAADNFLTDAGEVYLILGATNTYNNLSDIAGGRAGRALAITELGTSTFRGMVFVGRQERDAAGGGLETKRGKRSFGIGPAGDVDGDGRADILIGSILADPNGRTDSGEAYLIYGFNL